MPLKSLFWLWRLGCRVVLGHKLKGVFLFVCFVIKLVIFLGNTIFSEAYVSGISSFNQINEQQPYLRFFHCLIFLPHLPPNLTAITLKLLGLNGTITPKVLCLTEKFYCKFISLTLCVLQEDGLLGPHFYIFFYSLLFPLEDPVNYFPRLFFIITCQVNPRVANTDQH